MSDKFDGIILDIDGTIWNTTGIAAMSWNKVIDYSGFDVKKLVAQDLQKEFGKTVDRIALNLWPTLSPDDRVKLMADCCTEEHIAIRETSLDITYPGVLETIKELSLSENFYIVSNCQNGYIDLMLEKTGLGPYIKDVECFGRTGKGKAENLLMLKQRNQLNFPVYVGDTLTDANACSQAGIPFIWASYGFGKVENYYDKLNQFSDLKRILGLN